VSTLVAQDLFHIYRAPAGDVAALRGLSLELGEGEVVAVLGPSGSGKSTLLALAAGFLQPTSGELVVLGEHLGRASQRDVIRLRRRQIGILRQHYHRALPRELRVAEIVGMPGQLLGYDQRKEHGRVTELLERAGLADRAGAYPKELSGGEQQRVALCAALAKRPRLLLTDEPTGELDSVSREAVVSMLLDLTSQTGTAALIVTHDPYVAGRTHRTIHVRDGRLAAEGSDRPVLIVDEQGWLRLPGNLRRQAQIGRRVIAAATSGRIELTAEAPDHSMPTLETEPPSRPKAPRHSPPKSLCEDGTITISSVVKRYGTSDAPPVIDLSWTASSRALNVVVGRSGSGKTTLLNLIAALDRPDFGEIRVGGRRIDQLDANAAARFRKNFVGYLSQHSTLIDYMTAVENVELALAVRGYNTVEARDTALRWLEWVGLGRQSARRADHLSGGEQRRVALARALAPSPALLLADEPTAHLDQAASRGIIRLLAEAVEDHGTTVVAASHDPDLIAATANLLNLDGP